MRNNKKTRRKWNWKRKQSYKQNAPITNNNNDNNNTFVEKELELLKQAEAVAERKQGEKQAQAPEVRIIIRILEDFLRDKKLICYGGTAINNILPTYDQFYEKSK